MVPKHRFHGNQVQGSALITVAVTPLLDVGLERLLTPGDYELLCRKQDEDRVRKLEVSDKEHLENSACDIICPDKVRVRNKQDETAEQTNSKCDSRDTIPTIGLENFVNQSSDGAVCSESVSTVVQRTNTKKNPDPVDEGSDIEGSECKDVETVIEPGHYIIIEQLNSAVVEQLDKVDVDPEQLESLVVELPTTTVEKWKNKKKNVAPKYRKRKKVKKEKYLILNDGHLRHRNDVPQTIIRSRFKVRVRQNGN